MQRWMQMIGAFNEFWANLARERALENVELRREKGEHVGRPKKLDEVELEDVYKWRRSGLSYQQVAILVKEVHGIE